MDAAFSQADQTAGSWSGPIRQLRALAIRLYHERRVRSASRSTCAPLRQAQESTAAQRSRRDQVRMPAYASWAKCCVDAERASSVTLCVAGGVRQRTVGMCASMWCVFRMISWTPMRRGPRSSPSPKRAARGRFGLNECSLTGHASGAFGRRAPRGSCCGAVEPRVRRYRRRSWPSLPRSLGGPGIVLRYPSSVYVSDRPLGSITDPVQRFVLSTYRVPGDVPNAGGGYTPPPTGVIAELLEDVPAPDRDFEAPARPADSPSPPAAHGRHRRDG